MMIKNNGILFLVILIFLMGLYFVTSYTKTNLNEGFENSPRCPDMLIQKGATCIMRSSKQSVSKDAKNLVGKFTVYFVKSKNIPAPSWVALADRRLTCTTERALGSG